MLKINDASVVVTRRQAVLYKGRTLGLVRREEDYLIVNRKRTRSGRYDDNYHHISDVLAYMEGQGGLDSEVFALVMFESPILVSTGRAQSVGLDLQVRTKAGLVVVIPTSVSANSARVTIQRDGARRIALVSVDDRASKEYVDKTKF